MICKTVARKSSIGRLCICIRGFDIEKLVKTPLICTVTYFNLGVLGASFGGANPPNPPRDDRTKDMDDESFVTEMRHLLFLHSANFGKGKLLPQDLLNKIYNFKLQERFPNVGLCICLRILLTIPAIVASSQ